ncbi:MAG TPA: 5'/3'-nucleotidase SurE [Acidimicrobiia bacterium]|nr:5'/3'-nucleotidase SurE [Acidimicrobiia bacterium]
MSTMSANGEGEHPVDLEVSLEELSRRAAAPDGAVQHAPTGRRLRCLVTNDDGIGSEGLRVLALVALEAGFDVVVAAPMRECSGASASITAVEEDGRFVVEARTLPGLEEACAVLAVGGLPAFIALTGMRGAFGPTPDIVLSGINNGPNTGYAVLHSGTAGAALTASTFGARAMAVSLNVRMRTVSGAGVAPPAPGVGGRPPEGSAPHWETAAEIARRALPVLLGSEPGTVLNLNAPNVPVREVRGLERARLARFGAVQTNVSERGEGYVKVALAEIDAEYEPGTDAALIAAGYATITPLTAVCEAGAVKLPEFASRSGGG